MKNVVVLLLTLLLFLTVSIGGLAQTDSARLTGSVTDVQGAVVPNAVITLTNEGTGRVFTTHTGGSGDYNFNALPPGQYKIEVKASSFRTVTQSIILRVTQVAAANYSLQPGAVTDTVEVTNDVPLVETANSSISQVVVGRQITELPLNGRNFTQLATLVPGVTRPEPGNNASGSTNQTETFRFGEHGGAALVVNGLRPQANNFLIDGIDNNESLVNTIIFFPPAEAIQEFRVDTNVAPAQFGRAGGGIVNVGIKPGTNSIHGSAFEFIRNSALDARDYFNSGNKNSFRRNQFGGTLGGPVIKNKLFLFGDYQGLRQSRPQSVDYATVPTQLMRQGNFTELLAEDTTIYDPTTNRPFAGNIIPTARINKVGQNFLKAFPEPNCGPANSGRTITDSACNLTRQNYRVSRFQTQTFDDFDIRGDWSIRAADTLFARYSYGEDVETTTSRLAPNLPSGMGSGDQENHPRSIAIGETHTFGAALVNEFRTAWVRTKFGYLPPMADQKVAADLGIPGANPTPLLGGGALIGGYNSQLEYTGDYGPYIVPENTFQFSDTLSWSKGAHNMKFGATILRRQVNLFRPNRGKGFFFLVGNGSQGHSVPWRITGYEVSDLLAGFVDNYTIGPPFGMVGTRNWETGYFVQDDLKINSRLTLNLGLRYDLYTWPVEVLNRQANFDVKTGKLVLASDSDASFVPTDKNNFAPRIGLAFDVFGTGKTVLRGGYGMFYFVDRGGVDNQLAQNPPFSGYSQFNFNNGYHITLGGMVAGTQGLLDPTQPGSASNPYVCYTACDSSSVNPTLPTGSVDNIDLNNPQNVSVFAALPSNRNSYVQQWNVQLQQNLGTNMAFYVGYVGTRGDKLTNYYNMNRDPYGGGARVFPNLGNVNVQATIGHSTYHGLQAQVERRLAKGLQFTAAYTWSHAIDDQSGNSDFRNLWLDRGNSSLDSRHRFVLSSLYELPFGRGKRFVTGMSGIAQAVLGGWQANPIIVLQSGYPFDVNNGYTRLNLVGDPQVGDNYGPSKKNYSWINAAAFAQPTAGTWGNLGRNHFYGPGTKNVDFSLSKDFQITERVKTQFRSEFFNLFNTPQFAQPDGNISSATFGQIRSVRTSSNRQVQFALRLTF